MFINKFTYVKDGTTYSITSDEIAEVTYIEEVNDGDCICLGSCVSAQVSATFFGDYTKALDKGTVVSYYRDLISDESEVPDWTLVGTFVTQKPSVVNRNQWSVVALDNLSLLEKSIDSWIETYYGQTKTLLWIAQQMCSFCGLDFYNDSFDLSSMTVTIPSVKGMSARDMLSYVAQLAGCFIRARSDGDIEFAWYEANIYTIGTACGSAWWATAEDGELELETSTGSASDDGSGNITLSDPGRMDIVDINGEFYTTIGENVMYKADGLTYENFSVSEVDKVQVVASDNDSDVGVVYPSTATGSNCYRITNNPLIYDSSVADLETIAEHIYSKLDCTTYTPLTVKLFPDVRFGAGDVVAVADINGNTMQAYIMSATFSADGVVLESRGSESYDDVEEIASESYADFKGKMMTLQKDVNGLMVEVSDNLYKKQSGVEITSEEVHIYHSEGETIQNEVTIDAEGIEIAGGGYLKVDSTNFTLTEDGSCSCKDFVFYNSLTGKFSKTDDRTFYKFYRGGVNTDQGVIELYSSPSSGDPKMGVKFYAGTNGAGGLQLYDDNEVNRLAVFGQNNGLGLHIYDTLGFDPDDWALNLVAFFGKLDSDANGAKMSLYYNAAEKVRMWSTNGGGHIWHTNGTMQQNIPWVQHGSANITTPTSSGGTTSMVVSFARQFPSVPNVVVSQPFTSSNLVISDVTERGFTVTCSYVTSSAESKSFDYIAVCGDS